MDERLAGYLAVAGVAGRGGRGARLLGGQFHDVVLAGEVAYRFPRDEESRRKLPAVIALLDALSRCGLPVPVPVAAGHVDAPLGQCHVALTRLAGEPHLSGVLRRSHKTASTAHPPGVGSHLDGPAGAVVPCGRVSK